MKTQKILNIAIGALALSLAAFSVATMATMAAGGGRAAEANANGGPAWYAVWYNNPGSVREAYDLGSAAVLATVGKIEQAPDIVVPASGEPEGVDRVPNQSVSLKVDEVLKGDMRSGGTLELFHTGTSDRWADGDPAYAVGEQYVLFLTARDDGRWVVVSPEGRYSVRAGAVWPASDRPGVAATSGMSLDQFKAILKGSSNKGK